MSSRQRASPLHVRHQAERQGSGEGQHGLLRVTAAGGATSVSSAAASSSVESSTRGGSAGGSSNGGTTVSYTVGSSVRLSRVRALTVIGWVAVLFSNCRRLRSRPRRQRSASPTRGDTVESEIQLDVVSSGDRVQLALPVDSAWSPQLRRATLSFGR